MNSFFVFSKWSQALYMTPSCLECISGTNLSPANKNLFVISSGKKNEVLGCPHPTNPKPTLKNTLILGSESQIYHGWGPIETVQNHNRLVS